MFAFSYTAPVFSEDDEQAERKACTEEEQTEAHTDAYGERIPIVETEELVQNALLKFQVEFDALPDDHKIGYHQAVEQCPIVVEEESAPIRFLRCEDFDVKQAAIRLAKYWDHRIELFGSTRAFLPMTLVGAMADDMEAFTRLGDDCYLLPTDKAGRAVYFSDKTRSTHEKLSKNEQLRILWYYLHTAIENESVQRAGLILIAKTDISKLSQFHRSHARTQFLHLNEALPIQVRGLHTCRMPMFFVKFVVPTVKLMLGKKLRMRYHSHHESETPSSLHKFLLQDEHLPIGLGGTFHYDSVAWLESRRVLEEARIH